MQQISTWQVWKWNLQRKWQLSLQKTYILISWAYIKVFFAKQFATREFSSFLDLDHSAMSRMSNSRQRKYIIYVAKARATVGNRKFDPNITREDLDKQFQSLLYEFKNRK